MNFLDLDINRLILMIVPMVLGTVLHELAHAYAAFKLGDPTAQRQGRLTLNPLAHLDPAGSLIFIVTALTAPFAFGWAKPVPINPGYFKNRRSGEIIVSVAGPLTNFIVAFVFMALLRFSDGVLSFGDNLYWYQNMFVIGIIINVTLGWFNLMPLPPLDGSHIIANILPPKLAYEYNRLGKYSFIILILFLMSGLFGKIIGPLVVNTVIFFAQIVESF